jgi:hypothetical protein
VYAIGVVPLHDPGDVVRLRFSCAVPPIVGSAVLVGRVGATEGDVMPGVGADVATVDAHLFDAVTWTRSVAPTSEAVGENVVSVAFAMDAQSAPFDPQRSHLRVVLTLPLLFHEPVVAASVCPATDAPEMVGSLDNTGASPSAAAPVAAIASAKTAVAVATSPPIRPMLLSIGRGCARQSPSMGCYGRSGCLVSTVSIGVSLVWLIGLSDDERARGERGRRCKPVSPLSVCHPPLVGDNKGRHLNTLWRR